MNVAMLAICLPCQSWTAPPDCELNYPPPQGASVGHLATTMRKIAKTELKIKDKAILKEAAFCRPLSRDLP